MSWVFLALYLQIAEKTLKGQPIQLTDDNESRSIIFLTPSRQLDLEQKIRIDPISKCK